MQHLSNTPALKNALARVQSINDYTAAIINDSDRNTKNPLTLHRADASHIEYQRTRERLSELLKNVKTGRGNESSWIPAVTEVMREVRAHRTADEKILKKQISKLSEKSRYWSCLEENEVREEATAMSRLFTRDPIRFYRIFGEISPASESITDIRLRTIRKRIRSQARRYREAVALTARVVSKGKEEYISNGTLKDREQQIENQKTWADCATMVDKATGARLRMSEIADIDGHRKFAEMLAVSQGLETLAEKRKYGAIFVTLTAPPQYHPNPSHGDEKWDGSTPREAHEFISNKWKKIRARHAKRRQDWLFMRTAEPHKDSAAHWHIMIWSTESELKKIESDIKDIFNFSQNAAKVKKWDEAGAARASSYLMKYLQKATAREKENNVAADRVDAWRATYSIRSIQVGGIPRSARTIWRIARAMNEEQLNENSWLSETVIAARCGDFARFVESLEKTPMTVTREPVYLKIGNEEMIHLGTVITGIANEITGEYFKRRRGAWEIELDKEKLAAKLQLFIIPQGEAEQNNPAAPHAPP